MKLPHLCLALWTSATTFYDPRYVILLSKNAAFSLKAADDLCRRVQ